MFFIKSLLVLFAGSIFVFCAGDMQGDLLSKYRNDMSAEIPDKSHKGDFIFSSAIELYRKYISPQDVPTCVFEPTCSQFGHDAIDGKGLFKGFLLTIDRIQRCHIGTVVSPIYKKNTNGKSIDQFATYCHLNEANKSEHLDTSRYRGIREYFRLNVRPLGSECGFGDYLYALHDYAAAAVEYSNCCVKEVLSGDALLYNSALCHFCAGSDSLALCTIENIYTLNNSLLQVKANELKTVVMFVMHKLDLSRTENDTGIILPVPISDGLRRCIVALSYVEAGMWEKAVMRDGAPAAVKPWCDVHLTIVKNSKKYSSEVLRSPVAASILSAAIPGAGKVYCSQPIDGLSAFVSVGVPITIATYAYKKTNSLKWPQVLLFSFSGLMYTGNIYGSWFAAKRFNRYWKDKTRDDFWKTADSVLAHSK